MVKQIPLQFPVAESYGIDDFMPAPCNQAALEWIHRYPDWPYPAVVLYGERGAGKTHLLHIASATIPNLTVIDDAQNMFGDPAAEEQLFHDFNQCREDGRPMMLTMDRPVAQQDIKLPDLASRLRAAPQVEILSPDDAALQGVMVKLFHDRQLRVEPGVVNYILPRIERSFAAVKSIVERIDQNSMAAKRSVTVSLVRGLLE